MKKALLLLILIISAGSCKENNVEKGATPDLRTQNSDSVAVIDFSITGSDLIADLENQVNYNFCEDQNFIGKIKIEDSVITFPAFALKNCDWPNRYKHLVNILIDRDSVFIPEEFIRTDKAIENEILEIIKRDTASNKTLDFVVQWKNGMDGEIVKERLLQVLHPIREFSTLNKDETDFKKSKFKIRIGFVDSLEAIPAPKEY